MLSVIQRHKVLHLQAFRSGLGLLGRHPASALMTLSVIAMALALPALLWVFSNNMSQWTHSWKNNNQIVLYLQPALSDDQVDAVFKRVKETPGVAQAHLITAMEGLAELTAQEGMQEVVTLLPENPIPALIEITPIESKEPDHFESLMQALNTINDVDKVSADRAWIERWHALLHFVDQLTLLLGVVLAMVVILIINNALRFAIQSRQDEIQVLKWVGATDAFVARPFLYSGVFYGILGGVLALLLVYMFIYLVSWAFNPLLVLYSMALSISGLSLKQTLLLLVFVTIIGWLGAYLSVRKQLASIEPEL
ncbi:MAG: cell division protein [Legionella sp.]|nr:MAG: cell division protein [Legionella sp.]PJD98013.1 MAG: cell division protein [Legionella sp.]